MVTGSAAPAVTVIIPTFNSSRTLRLALESLRNQDFSDFEAWAVGDGCTDDSGDVVAALGDPRLHWKNLEVNGGSQAFPNNEGLRLARGRYIAYLGHDDLWMPGHLSGLVRFIQESGADLVHSLAVLIGPEGVREVVGPPRPGTTYQWHFAPPTSWMHRRDVIEACGGWRAPAELHWTVDFDFLHRLFEAGKRIGFSPQMTVLKFPSSWFGLYSQTEEPAQLGYWRAVQSNPEAVERRVAIELSTLLAQIQYGGVEPVAVALRRLISSVWRNLKPGGIFGIQSMPRLIRWFYRRKRAQERVWRGLDRR